MPTVLPRPTLTAGRRDEQLVALLRAGHAGAFDAIIDRYEGVLTGYARQLLGGCHHDAEEAVQDAFDKALGALRRDRERAIALKPWLYAITRNACLDRLRKPVRTVELAPLEPVLRDSGDGPEELVVSRERLRVLVGDLHQLPERQRAALVMHALEGRSHEETAAGLGVSVGASKTLVCRARQGLAGMRAAA